MYVCRALMLSNGLIHYVSPRLTESERRVMNDMIYIYQSKAMGEKRMTNLRTMCTIRPISPSMRSLGPG
jgi:hypothetical protein